MLLIIRYFPVGGSAIDKDDKMYDQNLMEKAPAMF